MTEVYDLLIRKKALKVQDRLGMRIGIMDGTSKTPTVKNTPQALAAMADLYRIGFRAFVLPPQLFSDIETTTDLYKTRYGDLIKIKDEARRLGIQLSLHHPDLGNQPENKIKVFSSIASVMDCRMFFIEPNFYTKVMPRDQGMRLAVHKINEIVAELRMKAKIGIETTGHVKDAGSIEDVIEMVKRTQSTEAVINWAHIHARGSGALRSQNDYKAIISKMRSSLGTASLNDAFFIFSGVRYGPSGEISHIPLARSDMNIELLIREIMSSSIKGTLILEDPDKEKYFVKNLDKIADMVR